MAAALPSDDAEMLQRKTVVEATGGRASVAIGKKPTAAGAAEATATFAVGDKVVIPAIKLIGVVRFSGKTLFAGGDWLGLELSDEQGKNDGSVKGERYFQCPPSHGLFVRPTAVVHLEEWQQQDGDGSARRRTSRAKTHHGGDRSGESRPSATSPGSPARTSTKARSQSTGAGLGEGGAGPPGSPGIWSDGIFSPGGPSSPGAGPVTPSFEAVSGGFGLSSSNSPLVQRSRVRSSQRGPATTGVAGESLGGGTSMAKTSPSVESHHIDDESDYEQIDPEANRSSLTMQHDADWNSIGDSGKRTAARISGENQRPRKAERQPSQTSGANGAAQDRTTSLPQPRQPPQPLSMGMVLPAEGPPPPPQPPKQAAQKAAKRMPTREEHAAAAAQLELAEAAEEHDPERIKRALVRARAAGVAREELQGAHSILSFEVQQSLLIEIEGVRASVLRLAQTVEAAEARAAQAEQRAALAIQRASLGGALSEAAAAAAALPHGGAETWSASLHEELEKRVWLGLEARVEHAIQGAVSRATSGLDDIVRRLRSDPTAPVAKASSRDEEQELRSLNREAARGLIRSSIASAAAAAVFGARPTPAAAAAAAAADHRAGGTPAVSSGATVASDEAKLNRAASREAAKGLIRCSIFSAAHRPGPGSSQKVDGPWDPLRSLEDEAAQLVGEIRQLASSIQLSQLEASAFGEVMAIRQSGSLMGSVERDARARLSASAARTFAPTSSGTSSPSQGSPRRPASSSLGSGVEGLSLSQGGAPGMGMTDTGSSGEGRVGASGCPGFGSPGSPGAGTGGARVRVRSSLKSSSRKGLIKKSVSFCHQVVSADESALRIQRAARMWLARRRRWELRAGRRCRALGRPGVGARCRHPAWARVFDVAVRRQGDQGCAAAGGLLLDEAAVIFAGFAWGVHQVHPLVSKAQLTALWKGFVEACEVERMRFAGFCDILEALAAGDAAASEFADIPLEDYVAMGVGASGVAKRRSASKASGHREKRRSFSGIFREASAGKAMGIDFRDFVRAMQSTFPKLGAQQVQALWSAFEDGTDMLVMGHETFCAMCEAVTTGPDCAAEFADMPVEDWLALAAEGAGSGYVAEVWDTNPEMQQVLERVEEEMAGSDTGSEDFYGGLTEEHEEPEY